MLERLPVAVGEMTLEWVIALEDDPEDPVQMYTAARRGLLRLRLVARLWREIVQRVVLANIEPQDSVIDLLDARPSLWHVVRVVTLEWHRNPALVKDTRRVDRCVAAALRSARNAPWLVLAADWDQLDEGFFGHCGALSWRRVRPTIVGNDDAPDAAEELRQVAATIVRVVNVLAPTLSSLAVDLRSVDMEGLVAARWPQLPNLESLELLYVPAGFVNVAMRAAPETTRIRLFSPDCYAAEDVGAWDAWPSGLVTLEINSASGPIRSLRALRHLRHLKLILESGCGVLGVLSSLPDSLNNAILVFTGDADNITAMSLLTQMLADPRRLPVLQHLRVCGGQWSPSADCGDLVKAVMGALEAACAERGIGLTIRLADVVEDANV